MAQWRTRQANPRAVTVTCRAVPHLRVTNESSLPEVVVEGRWAEADGGPGCSPPSARRVGHERIITREEYATNGSSQVGVPIGSSQQPEQDVSPSARHSKASNPESRTVRHKRSERSVTLRP